MNNKIIAYDLDGIFLSDVTIENGEQLDFRRDYIQPIFQPQGEYVIITGRPAEDRQDTADWIDRNLVVKPKKVYHGNDRIERSACYKAHVLCCLKDEIGVFVESNKEQAEELSSLGLDIKIVHLETEIQRLMRGLD